MAGRAGDGKTWLLSLNGDCVGCRVDCVDCVDWVDWVDCVVETAFVSSESAADGADPCIDCRARAPASLN